MVNAGTPVRDTTPSHRSLSIYTKAVGALHETGQNESSLLSKLRAEYRYLEL
jgi:hypothetical protein